MLGLIPMSCYGYGGNVINVASMADPGYPTPAVWSRFLGNFEYALSIGPQNDFLFEPNDIVSGTDLVMANYPHNPSGQAATRQYWERICEFCQKKDIRLFNDAAYAALVFKQQDGEEEIVPLTEVAVDFLNLSWAEAFSASKAIGNGTGWRVGAMAGSPDFISDISSIKGETDSGFVGFSAAGVLHALENDRDGMNRFRDVYQKKTGWLISVLEQHGMRLAARPKAGFFTLWQTPKKAFSKEVRDGAHFNKLMIENTGIAGVHFGPYIRYAVVGDIMDDDFAQAIENGFKAAQVSYPAT